MKRWFPGLAIVGVAIAVVLALAEVLFGWASKPSPSRSLDPAPSAPDSVSRGSSEPVYPKAPAAEAEAVKNREDASAADRLEARRIALANEVVRKLAPVVDAKRPYMRGFVDLMGRLYDPMPPQMQADQEKLWQLALKKHVELDMAYWALPDGLHLMVTCVHDPASDTGTAMITIFTDERQYALYPSLQEQDRRQMARGDELAEKAMDEANSRR